MTAPLQHPQPFNRISFITLNSNRLFTASQVADLIQKHSTASNDSDVMDELSQFIESETFRIDKESIGMVYSYRIIQKITELRTRTQEQL